MKKEVSVMTQQKLPPSFSLSSTHNHTLFLCFHSKDVSNWNFSTPQSWLQQNPVLLFFPSSVIYIKIKQTHYWIFCQCNFFITVSRGETRTENEPNQSKYPKNPHSQSKFHPTTTTTLFFFFELFCSSTQRCWFYHKTTKGSRFFRQRNWYNLKLNPIIIKCSIFSW